MSNESLRVYKSWSEKIIFEQAGKRTAEQLHQLISQVKQILTNEGQEGEGRLKNTIGGTKRSPNCDVHFVDGKIAYLPRVEEAIFVGDTHGDSLASEAIIKQTGFLEDQLHGRQRFLVFLGDYGDRGRNDIRNWEVVLALKSRYPQNVVLLRGNHEDGQYYPCDLEDGLQARFGKRYVSQLSESFLNLFFTLPNIVVTANGIVGVHGGIPHHGSMGRGGIIRTSIRNLSDIKGDEMVLRAIRWNDPDENVENFANNVRGDRERVFGKVVFEQFMKAIGGKVMIRSHEYPREGYKLFFNDRLVTIFSNGIGSSESSYQELVKPKFAVVPLDKTVIEIDPIKHIKDVDYSVVG